MKLLESIRIAMRALAANKLRSVLTMLGIIIGVGAASVVARKALNENMLYIWSPSDVKEQSVPAGKRIRLGGLVAGGSVSRATDSLEVSFVVTDGAASIETRFDGILPDLFREGQGVIAIGELQPEGYFQASEVLAKHDENYMPPEVAAALEASGKSAKEAAEYTHQSTAK